MTISGLASAANHCTTVRMAGNGIATQPAVGRFWLTCRKIPPPLLVLAGVLDRHSPLGERNVAAGRLYPNTAAYLYARP